MRPSAIAFLLAAAVYGQAEPDANGLLKKSGERFFGLEDFDVEVKVDAITFRPLGGLPSPVM